MKSFRINYSQFAPMNGIPIIPHNLNCANNHLKCAADYNRQITIYAKNLSPNVGRCHWPSCFFFFFNFLIGNTNNNMYRKSMR